MTSYTVEGTLKLKGETQAVSEKFSKREIVIEVPDGKITQYISLQLTQDKCKMLDPIQQGESLRVHFNLKGREWNGPQGLRYFNSLEAWKIEQIGSKTANAPAQSQNIPSKHDEDLPF